MSEAQDSATVIDQKIMSEESYQILAKSEDIQDQIVEAIQFYENRVHVTCTVSDDIFLYERVLPVTEYPIVPFLYISLFHINSIFFSNSPENVRD